MSRARERLARIRAQLYQLAGLREGGFFIQYDYSAFVPEAVSSYPELESLFAGSAGTISELADRILALRAEIETARCEGALKMDSMMYPPLDAMAAYAMLRTHRPRQVLEIGSGHSTAVLARALAENGAGELTCIDPSPHKPIDHLDVNLLRRLLQEDDAARVETFEAGDVLFIDSSHIMLQGTDVDIQFNRMFPRLKPGVLVHLHDVFLPDGYPPKWRNRWYSEQAALIGWILSGYFEVIYPGHYATTRMREVMQRAVEGIWPDDFRLTSGSLWLRRAGASAA